MSLLVAKADLATCSNDKTRIIVWWWFFEYDEIGRQSSVFKCRYLSAFIHYFKCWRKVCIIKVKIIYSNWFESWQKGNLDYIYKKLLAKIWILKNYLRVCMGNPHSGYVSVNRAWTGKKLKKNIDKGARELTKGMLNFFRFKNLKKIILLVIIISKLNWIFNLYII